MKSLPIYLLAVAISIGAPLPSQSQDLGGDLSLHKLLVPGADWEKVVDGLGFADAPFGDAQGNFYYSDMKSEAGLFRVSPNGKISPLFPPSAGLQGISGAKLGPDGVIYACQGKLQRVISIHPTTGQVTELATGVRPNDLVVSADGFLFFTETPKKAVHGIRLKDKQMFTGSLDQLKAPNGITLSPDQGTLGVSDYRGLHVWTFRVKSDGHLDAPETYMTMRTPVLPDAKGTPIPERDPVSRGDGMTMDENGRWYVATGLGVQVFDPTGRECGLIPKPQPGNMTSVFLGGPEGHYLHATCGSEIYRIRIQAKGILHHLGPIDPLPVPYKK